MKRTPWTRFLLLATGMLAVVPVKCNSILAKRSPVTEDDGYDYVLVSGSNMPQRVKRGGRLITTSAVDIMGGETAREISQKSQTMGHLPGN